MGESIQQKIRAINRSTRRMIWCWAISSLIAAVLLILLASGAIDYLFRYQDVGMRYLVFVLAIGGLLFCVRRLVTAVRAVRFSDLEIARLIEQRSPEMGDRLTSSLQFIERMNNENDAVVSGESMAMRRAVIGKVEKDLAKIDLQNMLDYSSVRLAVVFASVALLAAVSLFVFRSEIVRIGIQRVLMPWSQADWPRRNQLYFHNLSDKMPQGAEFVAVVKDHNQRLPDEVRLEFMLLGETVVQTRVMQSTGDAAQVRLENVQRSLRYRAVGGDDQTPWHEMLVLPAPQLEKAEFRIIAPDYAQLPDRLVSGAELKAIVGSTLQATGIASEELVAVHVNWTNNERTKRFAAALDENHRNWRFPGSGQFTLKDSGVMQFELRNAESISGGLESRFRIQVVADQPPVIDLNSLDSSRSLTPEGKVRLLFSVTEDVRLKHVNLTATAQTNDRQLSHSLWEDQQPTERAQQVRFTDETATGGPQRLEAELVFEANSLQLKFGDVVTLVVNATDAHGQIAYSNKLNFRITTANELLDGLMERQNEIFKRFREALAKQQQSARQVENAQSRLAATDQPQADISDLLYAARLSQDQVAALLNDPDTGAERLIRPILEEARNGLEQMPIFRQTEQILREVASINSSLIEPAQFQMAAAIRTSKQDGASEELDQPLKSLQTTQLEIIRRLQKLVGQISQIDRLRDVVRQWLEIREQQQRLSALTNQLSRKSVGKKFDQLDSDTKSLLKQASLQQAELASEAQLAMESIFAISDRDDVDAVEQAQISSAKALLIETPIDPKMREAASDLAANQLGNAARNQLESEQLIENLLQILEGPRPDSSQQSSGDSQAGETVRQLIQRQTKITAQLQTLAASGADANDQATAFADLLKQQTEIIGQLSQMQTAAEGRQDQLLSDLIAPAQQSAEQARQSLAERQAAQALQNSDETIENLNRLEESLQERIARDQFREQQARDSQAVALLTELIQQQQAAIAQWQKLESDSAGPGEPARMSVAETEHQLSEATLELSKEFADQIAVEFVLRATAQRLAAVAESIRDQQDAGMIQREMQLAAGELARLLKAISQQQQSKQPGDQQNADAEQAGQSPLSEAELRLLLETQRAILDETRLLHESRETAELTNQQQIQLDSLTRRQSALQGIVQLYLKDKPENADNEKPEKNTIPELPGF